MLVLLQSQWKNPRFLSEEKWELRGGEKWYVLSAPSFYRRREWVFPLRPCCFQSSQTCHSRWNFHILWNALLEPRFFFSHPRVVNIAAAFRRRGDSAQSESAALEMIHTLEATFSGMSGQTRPWLKCQGWCWYDKCFRCFCDTLLANHQSPLLYRLRYNSNTIWLQRSLNLLYEYFFSSKITLKNEYKLLLVLL